MKTQFPNTLYGRVWPVFWLWSASYAILLADFSNYVLLELRWWLICLFIITHRVSDRARHLRTGGKPETGYGNLHAASEHGERGAEPCGVGLWTCIRPLAQFLGPYRKLAQQYLAYWGHSCWPNNACALTYMYTNPHTDWGAHVCILVQHSHCLLGSKECWLLEKDQINHVREREKGKQYDKEKKSTFSPFKCHEEMSRKLLYWK